MRAQARSFWAPKDGNSPNEYEDAVFPEDAFDRFFGRVRLAIADGSTESSYSGPWARLLVEHYGSAHGGYPFVGRTWRRLQQKWWAGVQRDDLPWYAAEKLEQGAYATFLGVTLQAEKRDEHQARW